MINIKNVILHHVILAADFDLDINIADIRDDDNNLSIWLVS